MVRTPDETRRPVLANRSPLARRLCARVQPTYAAAHKQGEGSVQVGHRGRT